jgi:magnesium transporter
MIHTFFYHKGKPVEKNLTRAQMLAALHDREGLLWVDLEDPDEFETECLVEIFNFHDLALDDCLNDLSQPKVDDYEEYLFLVLHAVNVGSDKEILSTELDVFLGPNYVVTFHKRPLQSVEVTRELAQKKPDSLLGHGSDKLVHQLLDQLVDRYQPVIDRYDEKVDQLEEDVFKHTQREHLEDIIQLRRDLFHFRRIVAPQRDTVNYLTRTETEFIREENRLYFRDVYDHLFRLYGQVEALHEALTGIMQAYFSYSSHRLNQSITRMTVMATLTMPAIVIASIYGMNFQNMPELSKPWGYPLALAAMGATSLAVLIYMKIKKWF